MIPRLLKADAADFSRMGFGALNGTISAVVTEELNNAPELMMSVLVDDPLFPNIEIGSIITAEPNKTDLPQAFVVEEITKPINGIVEIYATHIAQHRGKLIPVDPFTAASLDAAFLALISNSLETNPFTLQRAADKANTAATMTQDVPHSFRELLGGVEGSIIDTYKGEWAYDNYTLTLYNKRGRDNGARVIYGRNMTEFSIEEEFNWDGSATGVVPYWQDENATVIGAAQYANNAHLFPYNRTVVHDFSENFDTQPTTAQLETFALSWIRNRGKIGATIEVAFDHIDGGDNMGLGDVIRIYNNVYDYSAESRIIGTKYDVLKGEYISVTIGDRRATLNDAIAETVTPGETVTATGAAVDPSTTMPKMDGTADIGTEQKYARGDHVHPSDTTRFDKAGDDLTGNVRAISSEIDITDTAPADDPQNGPAFQWTDANGTTIGTFRLRRLTAANDGAVVMALNVARGGVQNTLSMGVDDNGARVVSINASAAWRTALGAAPLASPAFTGNPTAPTQSAGNNSTRIATTAFVNGEISGKRILGHQTVTLATTASAAVAATATTTGTITAVTGATDYILVPKTCSYGIFTALSRSGTTINATLRNISNAAHTMASSVEVIAIG